VKALIATGQSELPVALADISVPRPKPGEALVKVAAFFGQPGRDIPARRFPGRSASRQGHRRCGRTFFGIRDGPGSVTIRQFSYYDFDTPYGEDLAILVRLVATGRLHPEIGRVADWSDTAATLTDLYQRRIRGNAVLTISPEEQP
jgi:NADPH:quinone reductase-like Zn-dependent oxidoreductase